MAENSGAIDKRGKWRNRVIWIVILVLVGSVVALFVTHGSKLEKKFDEIRAAGFPATLDEVNDWYSSPEGAENAADFYVPAFGLYVPPVNREPLPIIGKAKTPKPGEVLPAETIKLIEEFLADNEEALELLYDGAKIKHCRYPIDFMQGMNVLLPNLSENKRCVQLLCLKAMLDAESGRADLFIEDFQVASALADSRRNEPTLISQLVRIACLSFTVKSAEYAVNRVEFDDEQLGGLIRLMTDAEDTDAMLRATAGERPMMMDYLLHPNDYPGISGIHPIGLAVYSATGLNKSGLLEYMDYYENNISALRLPLHERIAAIKKAEEKMDKLPWYHALIEEFVFAAGKVTELDLRCIAYLRVGRVGLAAWRYRQAKGKLPGTLAELAPGYIEAVPLDPFDGAALKYKFLDKGYVVYSVGMDGVDNDGTERTAENRKGEHDIIFTVER